MADCRYTRAQSVDEAVACLTEARGDGHIIAGGVALGILMNEKLVDPTWLIDISALDEVRGIELLGDGALRIGALVTHREIERSDIVARAVPMLPEMAAEIACGRIKNRGTIGGNICLADPQGDPPAAILALRARRCALSGRTGRATSRQRISLPTSTRPPSVTTKCCRTSAYRRCPPTAAPPSANTPRGGRWTTPRRSAPR
jgi:CO/xanthine dehydrogenase FAD-binding subunit